jgi:class 3 adenylate cyclase/tetratricopeptide (TPR) repeat protein
MDSVREWLAAIGLDEFAEAFERERIDLEALAELSEADLESLGLPMGPRRKVLKALRAPAPAPAAAPREAERRQITVMFCDLVGSTALSEKLDPEDLRTLMQGYQQAAGAVIERYGGHVAQYLGDGLMTYFGWPSAHEDDAERAVRASLDIVEAVNAMELQVRIGIATGPVVVGETGAGDASVPKLAVGETPNFAARLQGLAGADEIVVGPSTRRLLGGTFELADMGEQALKGIVEPVQAHRVTAIAATEGRFEAQHQHLTPLVGREAEMTMVMARWEQAKGGEGQVIVLGGEPGIGKSRITQALRERVADEPHTRLRYQCSPYHTNSALHPVIEQIERAAGFQRDDAPDQKLDKLEQFFPDGAGRTLVGSLLSLPIERYPALAMSPQKQKEDTLRALAEQVMALAADRPVLLIFEDAHWIDPTSQELLDLMVPMMAAHRVLAVITHRPEYQPPWTGQGHVAPLSLTRLGRADAAAMVARVSDTPLPDEILDQIVAKTDGVPLFVEELTKTVIESGADTAHAIPETLQDSLMARLDKLASVKEVAQIGACIGREFGHELLAAVSPLSDSALKGALQQLVNSDLIFRSGSTCVFKHALVQDVAYEGLLKVRRQELHALIAEKLSALSPDVENQQPEVLAQHLTAAGDATNAAKLWLKASQRTLGQGAIPEATNHLYQGLEQLSQWPAGEARDRMELDLKVSLGSALSQSVGLAAKETTDAYDEAYALCQTLGESDPQTLFAVLWGIWLTRHLQGKAIEVVDTADYMLSLAGEDKELVFVAETARMDSLFFVGRHNDCIDSMKIAMELENKEWSDQHLVKYSFDMRNINELYASMSYYLQGYPDRALDLAERVERFGEESPHPHIKGFSLVLGSGTYLFMRSYKKHYSVLESAIEYCEEVGLPYWVNAGRCWQAISLGALGEPEEAVSRLEEIIPALHSGGVGAVIPYFRAALASLLTRVGHFDDAKREIAASISQVDEFGERIWESEIRRVQGDLFVAEGAWSEAAEAFEKAIAVARAQSAKSWELRAATSLARLWQAQGNITEARDLLSPVYGWFTEGFDTPDLVEAKALLDDLA